MAEEGRAAGSAFGALLRRHRLAAGLSQEELADQARMSVNGISALERGHRRHPYRETVTLLAKALSLAEAEAVEFQAAAARPRHVIDQVDAGAADADEPGDAGYKLPAPLSMMIGRESAVAGITELLGTGRLLTIVGTGGVGKTRVALQIASLNVASYRDGACFVELAPLGDPRLVAQTVAASLRLNLTRKRAPIESLQTALRDREMLIVLDNCEHVIDEVAAVAEALLQSCPRLRILTTSRERLNVGGERVYRLPSLSVPPTNGSLSLEELLRFSACELFVTRAREADDSFEVGADTQACVADICRRLDGIPLAIELAAARVRVFTPAQIAGRLNERFRLLTGGSRTALPRQQTMRATIDWSHELLSERERTLLRRVGIFAGGWTLEAAVAVCAMPPLDGHDVLDGLNSLEEKSLIVADGSTAGRRYRLLESTRAYALEKLEASGEREMSARGHAQWIAGLTIGFRKSYYDVPREQWLRQLGPEVDNIRTALSYAVELKSDATLAGRILWLARVSDALLGRT